MSRLLNRQRQLAEQGRLRLGYTVPATKKDGTPTTRPVRSETWVLTSHSREHIDQAASLWGGDVEQWTPMGNGASQWRVITTSKAIDAILPPGDPLTQAYETWSRGGCQRRCDGVTEQFSGSPCLCLAEFGEHWYDERNACDSKSRLKVLLPDMNGLGSWRMETGSFYATDEIAGMVDTIRGAIGDAVLVPVTLRIEPRTRVAGGQTKQFVVPVLELRGVTAGALLSGQAQDIKALGGHALDGQRQIAAPANPYDEYLGRLEEAATREHLSDIWKDAVAEHLVGTQSSASPQRQEFFDAFTARSQQLAAAETPASDDGGGGDAEPQPAADGAFPADVVQDGDADAVWQQLLLVGGQQGMTLGDVSDGFLSFSGGVDSSTASAAELQAYLDKLNGERVPA